MIYCPSCKKPSAQKTGNCPHCGFNLGGNNKNDEDVSRRHAQATAPTDTFQFGGADVDLEESDSDASLELATTDSVAPGHLASNKGISQPEGIIRISGDEAPPRFHSNRPHSVSDAAMAAQVAEVEEIAQFGPCDEGIIGVMKYGLRVYQRLPQLTRETEAVKKEKLQAWEALEVAKARLGRQFGRKTPSDPHMQRLVKKAQKADGKLDDIQRQEDRIDAQFHSRYVIIDERHDTIRNEMVPVEEEAARRKSAFEHISKERARLNAKIKRTEIELRNTRELIEKKQLAYADLKRPKEERAILLKEIAEVDHRQPPLLKRLSMEQRELEETAGPFETISEQLQKAKSSLAGFNTRIAEVKKERSSVEREHQAALDEIHTKAQGESKLAQEAWAAVGETVYVNKLVGADQLNDVAAAAQHFFTVQEKLTLCEQALTSYNVGAYDLAKKYWIGAAAVGGALIVVIVASFLF